MTVEKYNTSQEASGVNKKKEKTFFERFYEYFTQDIAIDLGTANTLVYIKGKGIILDEPSVVAVQRQANNQNRVLAVGQEAKHMLGRTPGTISSIRPIKDGVIADFEITQEMLKYFIAKSTKNSPKLVRPSIIICVPYGITQVEKKAVKESAHSAGARDVYLIEEPMAAAIGANLPITEPIGNMVVDIGGGTTGIAVISLGGIVDCVSIKVAGDKLDEAIISYVRKKFNLLIGERTAENIKINLGSAYPSKDRSMEIKGRNLIKGTPKTIEITNKEVNEALSDCLNEIINAIGLTLEKTPPELAADIVDSGIVLTGGGALLENLDILLREKTGLPITVAENPLTCVVLGAGKALDQIDLIKRLSVN